MCYKANCFWIPFSLNIPNLHLLVGYSPKIMNTYFDTFLHLFDSSLHMAEFKGQKLTFDPSYFGIIVLFFFFFSFKFFKHGV